MNQLSSSIVHFILVTVGLILLSNIAHYYFVNNIERVRGNFSRSHNLFTSIRKSALQTSTNPGLALFTGRNQSFSLPNAVMDAWVFLEEKTKEIIVRGTPRAPSDQPDSTEDYVLPGVKNIENAGKKLIPDRDNVIEIITGDLNLLSEESKSEFLMAISSDFSRLLEVSKGFEDILKVASSTFTAGMAETLDLNFDFVSIQSMLSKEMNGSNDITKATFKINHTATEGGEGGNQNEMVTFVQRREKELKERQQKTKVVVGDMRGKMKKLVDKLISTGAFRNLV